MAHARYAWLRRLVFIAAAVLSASCVDGGGSDNSLSSAPDRPAINGTVASRGPVTVIASGPI